MKKKILTLWILVVFVIVLAATATIQGSPFETLFPDIKEASADENSPTPDACSIQSYPAPTSVVCPTDNPYPAPNTPTPEVIIGDQIFLYLPLLLK